MGKSITITADSTPKGFFINPDGTKLFVVGDTNDTIYRYSLSPAWDISSATIDSGQTLSLGSALWRGLHFKSDGTKLYVVDLGNDRVHQWTMSTAWDLTSAGTSDGFYTTTTPEGVPFDVQLNPAGTKLYVVGQTADQVSEFDVTTAHDITGTVTYNSKQGDPTGELINPTGFFLEDGTNDYVFVASNSIIYRYTMSTAFDISTMSYDTGQTFTYTEGSLRESMRFKPDGTQMYVMCTSTDTIHQYTLATAWDVTTADFDPPLTAAGAVTLAQTVSATASSDHHRADGTVSISPTMAATGTAPHHAAGAVSITPTISAGATNSTIHIDGAVSITPEVTATGRGTIHADGDVSITPETTSTGSVPPIAYGAVEITPEVAGTTSTEVAMAGDMTFPAITADGWIEYNVMEIPPLTASGVMTQTELSQMTLPSLTIDAVMAAGGKIYGSVELPALQVTASTDNQAEMVIPSLTVTGSMVSTNQYAGSMTLPPLEAYGGTEDQRFLSGEMTLPVLAIRSNSTMVTTGVTVGAMTLPLLKVFGENAGGSVSTGDMVLPTFTMENLLSQLISAGILTADLTLPSVEAQAYIQIQVTLTHSGWALNTENMLTSEYDNFNYLLLTKAFGKHIGVAADGVYELTGDSDNTVDINADVLFGFDSFRTEDLKRVKTVHLGYRADNAGDLNVQIVVDGEDKIREYSVRHVSSTSGIKRGRATIAKGLKSRYWKYGLKNVAGADFLIDDLSVYVQQHNRKAQ